MLFLCCKEINLQSVNLAGGKCAYIAQELKVLIQNDIILVKSEYVILEAEDAMGI